VAVGIKTGADSKNITQDDILVIDPWDGTIKSAGELTDRNGNKRNIVNNMLRVPK
jgi:hypothetical protein